MKEIWIGEDQFRALRERNNLYVDKSSFIREILSHSSTVLLLPRPRRFGKTLNMTMLHAFFDKTQDSRALFEGLAITQDAEAMTHLNAHPTLFLSFKALTLPTWAESLEELGRQIAKLIEKHRSLLKTQKLPPVDRETLRALRLNKATPATLAVSLNLITEVLYVSTGKKVILLIDEYDAPVHHALANGMYEEVVSFFRVFLGEALKGNPYLERVVLTGILRIAKESIFSGLNNLDVHTVLDTPFSTCFGFTEAEVKALLNLTQSPHPMSEVRDWYNGYRFGETIIYNPWSILNMLQKGDNPLIRYWMNTSGNELIRDLIKTGEACTLAELDQLLSGKAVRKQINSMVTIRDRKPSSAWSLLLFSGYLTARDYDPLTRLADLVIPNHEVAEFYDDTVRDWLGVPGSALTMLTHLLEGKLDQFTSELAEVVVTTLSYHDTAKPYPEQVFHVFVLGVLVQLSQDYQLLSNRETGHGRDDLQLIPKKPGQPGFLFEFKAASSAKAEALQEAAKAALAQAFERDYAAQFRQAEVGTLYTIGLASYGKRLALASVEQTLPDGPRSEISTHLGAPEAVAADNPPNPNNQRSPAEAEPAQQPPKKPGTPTAAPPDSETQLQKAALVGQIQWLQQQKGQTPYPFETLIGLDQLMLETLIAGLKA